MKDIHELTGRISDIANGYMRAQVLFSATAANVFAHLEEPRTAAEAAQAVGWHPKGAARLLDALVALEFITKADGKYRNAEIASKCLVPGRENYQGHIVLHNRNCCENWERLDEALEAGSGVTGERRERSPEDLRHFILGMSNIARLSAQDMLGVLDISRYTNMLDVGGGPATYPIAFLKAKPKMRATVFDLPPVVDIAKEQVQEAGLTDRFEFVSGDLTTDAFPKGYDFVLLSNIIHMLVPAGIKDLFRKCCDALEPGGELIIKDFLTNEDRTGPPFSLMFALHMYVNTAEGGTYSVGEIEAWCKDAGFAKGRLVELTPQSRMWIATKAE